MSHHPRIVTGLLLAVLAASCGSPATEEPPAAEATTRDPFAAATATAGGLVAVPASFDLAVGDDRRFILGLFTTDRGLVLGGEVDLDFYYLGDEIGTATSPPVASSVATFLPVPGKPQVDDLSSPTVVSPADGAGVYETTVELDRAGVWGVMVTADVDGESMTATAPFEVTETSEIAAVGEPAPAVDNVVVGDGGELSAIDSRARGEDAELPDPTLHDATVAETLAAGRPMVVVVSTPTYCVSQFCGPITDTIEDLGADYGDVAEFIHLEVWQSFDDHVLNEAAAAWIQTAEGGSEPWVFAVDADGVVAGRWDNVLDEAELVDFLDGAGGSLMAARSTRHGRATHG